MLLLARLKDKLLLGVGNGPLLFIEKDTIMAKKKITDVVAELSGDFLAENGYELYNTEFVKEGRDWFLRVYIDKVQAADQEEPQYVSTEDCEKVSRFLSEKLDEADPIEQNYYLEVSSPGMDRPLIRPEHYERYVGEEVEIRLYKAMDGVKNLQGVLESFDKESGAVTVTVDGKTYALTLADIAKAKLAVVF